MKKKNSYYELILILTAMLFSCAELPPEEGDNDDGPDNPDVGVVTNDSFYVRVFENEQVEYFAHKNEAEHPVTGGFDVDCEIDMDDPFAADTHDIYCIAEAPELDLYHLGMTLQYNVPQDACVWLRRSAPAYYQFEPKTGVAATVEYFLSDAGSVYWTRVCDGLTNPRNIAQAGQAFNPQTQDPDVVFGAGCAQGSNPAAIEGPTAVLGNDVNVEVDGEAYCNADYTHFGYINAAGQEVTGPNICRGNLRVIIYREGSGDDLGLYFPGEVEDIDLTGKIADGLVGPGTEGDFANFAVLDEFVENTGLNDTYTILEMDAAAASPFFGVGSAANYFAASSGSANPASVLRRYYEFGCLDRNEEYLSRIRLDIRKWDEYSEFEAYAADGSGDPESGGAHSYGGVCTILDPNFPETGKCVNDRLDWDEIINKPNISLSCDLLIVGFNPDMPPIYPGACF